MKWARRTSGKGSSSWGTPRVGGGNGVGNVRDDTNGRLEDQIVEWDRQNGISRLLEEKILQEKALPLLATMGWSFSRLDQTPSAAGARSSNKGLATSQAISPHFGSWLMNWPPLWTDPDRITDRTKFDSWETASSRCVQDMLSAYSREGWKEEQQAAARERRAAERADEDAGLGSLGFDAAEEGP